MCRCTVACKGAHSYKVTGNLKGYDQQLNLVLDDAQEALRGEKNCCSETLLTLNADTDDPLRVTESTRSLGLVVLRGTAVMVIAPSDGSEEVANPFTLQ